MIVIKNVEMVCKLKSLWTHNSNILGDSRWSLCKVLDRCSVIRVHSESQARATREYSRRTAHSKCWTVQSHFLTPKCFWATFSASAGDALKVLFWSEVFLVLAGKGEVFAVCTFSSLVTPENGGFVWMACKSLVWSNMAYLNFSGESEDDNNTQIEILKHFFGLWWPQNGC